MMTQDEVEAAIQRTQPMLIHSILETMRRLTLKDWDVALERLDFESLQELHLFVLTVERARL